MPHLCFEGHNFSGKSTTIKNLVDEHGFVPVPEPDTFMSPTERWELAHTIPTNIQESQTRIDAFMASVKEQSRAANEILDTGKPVVSDRSVITGIAICQIGVSIDLPLDLEYALSVASKAIEDETIAIPDALIVMRAADRATHERRIETRGRLELEPLNLWEVAESVFEASVTIADRLMPGVQVVSVKSSDSTEANKQQIQPIIETLLPSV